jgi:putative AdoMet-dependent methyltransferase
VNNEMSGQFNELFDEWSADYDDTVAGSDLEYKEVFKSYDHILETIAARSFGVVLEFGVGTGNLTKRLVEANLEVLGVEPSKKMKAIAKQKLPEIRIEEGHFLDFPFMDQKVDTIVSSYAFHHLTDQEKEEAIQLYEKLLNNGGKIVFGDTIFKDKQAQEQTYLDAKNKGFHRLANDLNTEYYTTIPKLDKILTKHNFTTNYEQINDFVWIIEAKKRE